MAHEDAHQRRSALASLFAKDLDVGGGVVVRVRLSPRAWREALARNTQDRLAAANLSGDTALEAPDLSAMDPAEVAGNFQAAMASFMKMEAEMKRAKDEGERAALREMVSGIASSKVEGVTVDDVLAVPEMVERIIAALEAAAEAKDKKGEATAVSPAPGPSTEAATPAN